MTKIPTMAKPVWTPCDQHTLEPIVKWFGRYKCTVCGVVLYKRVVTADEAGGIFRRGKNSDGSFKRAQQLIAYKCPKCHGQTTGRKRVCPACKAKAREADATEA